MAIYIYIYIYSSYFRYFPSLGSALLSTTIYKVRSVSNAADCIQEVTGSHLRRDHELSDYGFCRFL